MTGAKQQTVSNLLLSEIHSFPNHPFQVRDDDAAIIAMADTNLQREYISPSEREKAYRMKLEAIKRQGARNDPTFRQNVGKLEAADIVGKDVGKSGRQVQRYIHLTDLIPPPLLELVDKKKIAVSPAIGLQRFPQNPTRPGRWSRPFGVYWSRGKSNPDNNESELNFYARNESCNHVQDGDDCQSEGRRFLWRVSYYSCTQQ